MEVKVSSYHAEEYFFMCSGGWTCRLKRLLHCEIIEVNQIN